MLLANHYGVLVLFCNVIIYVSEQLITEGRISPETSAADVTSDDVSMPTKRRREGTCYRRGRSGKRIIYIAYRCWKGKWCNLTVVDSRSFLFISLAHLHNTRLSSQLFPHRLLILL